MFCSLVHVLVKTKAMPSMVVKLIFKIKALSFKVFRVFQVFQIYQICSFYFFFDRCFIDYQFCEYRILDFMEVEHIVRNSRCL